MAKNCEHIGEIRDVQPGSEGCYECLASGDDWVHLRICLSCGHVGCCDSSKNKHATKHFRKTSHPLIQSFERGEDWIWCYVDELTMEPTEGPAANRPASGPTAPGQNPAGGFL